MRSGQPTGFSKMATLQVLNRQTCGLFLKDSEMLNAGWTATAKDFEKDSVKFGHTHKFGLKADSAETGILFIKPRLCIIFQSPVLVEDTQDGNLLIGELSNPTIKELWDADKALSEEKVAQGASLAEAKRRYAARTKSLAYVITKNGNVAHTNPLILSCKGLNSVEFFSKSSGYGRFMTEVGHAYSGMMGMPITNVSYDSAFYMQFIWEPKFSRDTRGSNGNEICVIEAQASPTAETLESFAVNEQVMEFFESLAVIPGIESFYLTHAQKEAKLLGGRYGVAPGYLAGSGETVLLEEPVPTPALNPGNDANEFLTF